jgi:hypothetical protein
MRGRPTRTIPRSVTFEVEQPARPYCGRPEPHSPFRSRPAAHGAISSASSVTGRRARCKNDRPPTGVWPESARAEALLLMTAKGVADAVMEVSPPGPLEVGGAVPQTALIPLVTRHYTSRLPNFATHSPGESRRDSKHISVRLRPVGSKGPFQYRTAATCTAYVGPTATVRDGVRGSRRLRLRPPR